MRNDFNTKNFQMRGINIWVIMKGLPLIW